MTYNQKYFLENKLVINNQEFRYYLSPNLVKNEFKHGFFTKQSSKVDLTLLSNKLNKSGRNCLLHQIHSNKVVSGSKTLLNKRIYADALLCDKHDQNLWIYTADCMPILFADKRRRYVAAVHCGRKGLENKIIKNLIKNFIRLGTLREDLIVSIGPSISKKNYLIDQKTLKEFYKKVISEESKKFLEENDCLLNIKNLVKFKKLGSSSLDLKKYAYIQLLSEDIPHENIDICRFCTYEMNNDFNSWRRSKTAYRQWNFICS